MFGILHTSWNSIIQHDNWDPDIKTSLKEISNLVKGLREVCLEFAPYFVDQERPLVTKPVKQLKVLKKRIKKIRQEIKIIEAHQKGHEIDEIRENMMWRLATGNV